MDKTPGTRDEKAMFRQIVRHDELARQLNLAGGPEKAGHLFDEIIELETDILGAYGLPDTVDNQKVLQSGYESRDPAWQVAERTMAKLGALARAEKAAPKFESRTDILVASLKNGEKPMNTLPRLGIPTHSYTLFIHRLVAEGEIDAEEALAEMDRSRTHLDDLYQFEIGNSRKRKAARKRLEPFQFQFLDRFETDIEGGRS
ncbi:MAG: hypothetical protein V1809_05820 [Planctomycetota bacterium]